MCDWAAFDSIMVAIAIAGILRAYWEKRMDKPYRLLDGMPYVPAVKTDVRETFKRFGWVPPSEQKKVEPKEQRSK